MINWHLTRGRHSYLSNAVLAEDSLLEGSALPNIQQGPEIEQSLMLCTHSRVRHLLLAPAPSPSTQQARAPYQQPKVSRGP